MFYKTISKTKVTSIFDYAFTVINFQVNKHIVDVVVDISIQGFVPLSFHSTNSFHMARKCSCVYAHNKRVLEIIEKYVLPAIILF